MTTAGTGQPNPRVPPRVARILESERLPVLLLAGAMVVSVIVTLYLGRGATFSGDEVAWIVDSPDLGGHILDPHGGHLLLVTRLIYRAMLAVFGLDYFWYRLLTVLCVAGTVGLLFAYLKRRVKPMVALAPCLVLLFFGSDSLHTLQGNGITIQISLMTGIAALLALDRRDGRGDAIAAVMLVIGVLTYTISMAFVIGAAVTILLQGRSRSLWVPALPAAVFLAWRVWLLATGFDNPGGDVTWSNLILAPSWIFQAAGASLAALTGLNFDFGSDSGSQSFVQAAGAALALTGFVLLGLRLRTEWTRATLWGVIIIACAMWTSQVLVQVELRGPADGRYMYPGALMVVLIAGEAMRRVRVTPQGLVAILAVALALFGVNVMLMRDAGNGYRLKAAVSKATVAAAELLATSPELDWGPDNDVALAWDREASLVGITKQSQPYGDVATPLTEVRNGGDGVAGLVDSTLIRGYGITLAPTGQSTDRPNCETARADGSGEIAVPLRVGRNLVRSDAGAAQVGLSRFEKQSSQPLGSLQPGQSAGITISKDAAPDPWKLHVSGTPEVTVCPAPDAGSDESAG